MNLLRLEAQLQAIVETQLLHCVPGKRPEGRVLERVQTALQPQSAGADESDRDFRTNRYTLFVSPDSWDHWNDALLLDEVGAVLKTVGEESGLSFASPPKVRLATDPGLLAGDFRIVPSYQAEPAAETQDLLAPAEASAVVARSGFIPEGAFFILQDSKVFPLNRAALNIGRRLDNDLVIEDPGVSRSHLQVRAIEGRFVLFDLGSTGGTFINGQRVIKAVLRAGDVVSLAGLPLVFGQETPSPLQPLTKTTPGLAVRAGGRDSKVGTSHQPPAKRNA